MTYDLEALSLGAGVQSTALLLMAQEGMFPTKPDCAIFSDTQWEPEAVYAQLERLIALSDVPIHIVTAGNLKQDVLSSIQTGNRTAQPPFYIATEDGGMLWRQCTKDYKVDPIEKKMRELLGYKPRQRIKNKARLWIGISTDEAHRMRDPRKKWIENFYPLIEAGISRNDCGKYLKEKGFGDIRKSACIACPYHSNAMWARMRDKYPEEFADAVEFDHNLRKGKLPGVTGDAYVHRKYLPLAEAVEATHTEDQLDFLDDFGEECEGMCGL